MISIHEKRHFFKWENDVGIAPEQGEILTSLGLPGMIPKMLMRGERQKGSFPSPLLCHVAEPRSAARIVPRTPLLRPGGTGGAEAAPPRAAGDNPGFSGLSHPAPSEVWDEDPGDAPGEAWGGLERLSCQGKKKNPADFGSCLQPILPGTVLNPEFSWLNQAGSR